MDKFRRSYIRRIRYAVQWGLFSFIVYGGYRFYLFAEHFKGGGAYVDRPGMVEGFLPIGALMSLKVWMTGGSINSTHPAALMILVAALLVSLLLMKSFCGWICPVGTVSELFHKIGRLIFRRNFRLHPYMDYPLRLIKYALLGFFIYIIFFRMDAWAMGEFMSSPYWRVADVKMLHFFTDMSRTSAIVLGVLAVLSLFIKNFWCRYLCPYGALTGILGVFSPLKVTRDEEMCIHCHKCTWECPHLLDVEGTRRVISPECSGCVSCVSVCPARGALDVATPGRIKVKPLVYALMVLMVFFGVILAAKRTGHWESGVTYEEYRRLIPMAGRFDHP